MEKEQVVKTSADDPCRESTLILLSRLRSENRFRFVPPENSRGETSYGPDGFIRRRPDLNRSDLLNMPTFVAFLVFNNNNDSDW